MTTSVTFFLSYDLSKELFIALKVDIYFNEKYIVVMDVIMTLLVPAKMLIHAGISRTPDPASRDEENWVRTHGFGKRRVPGRKVFLP